jgi:hypothetical protein
LPSSRPWCTGSTPGRWILYAGQESGILKSTNGGETWAPASRALKAAVWGVTVDPHLPRLLYAITAARVIVSADHGATDESATSSPYW